MLAPAAASSLDKPNAIAAQNLLSSSRPATAGRPGEGNGALPERSERRRFNLVIVTPHEALRRLLESAVGPGPRPPLRHLGDGAPRRTVRAEQAELEPVACVHGHSVAQG